MPKAFNEILGRYEDIFQAKPFPVFHNDIIEFLNELSKQLFKDKNAKSYKDIMAMAYFIRASSLKKLKNKYVDCLNRIGQGVAFHITPSNIPVQFFHSLIVSLLAGNTNIIRLSQTEFAHTDIICENIEKALTIFPTISNRICLVKYGHNQETTNYFSANCDVRIIWGGDATISEIRKSPLSPRAYDVTFADRFSLCLIDAQKYTDTTKEQKQKIAKGFYLDTYFSDQNACNSPRLLIWKCAGEEFNNAAYDFWHYLKEEILSQDYILTDKSAIDKLVLECEIAMEIGGYVCKNNNYKNYLNLVNVSGITDEISKYKGYAGFFIQTTIAELCELINYIKKDWQTLTYFGIDPHLLCKEIIESGVKGIDRIVPIGNAGIPSLKWDGLDFIERLSREIVIEKKVN